MEWFDSHAHAPEASRIPNWVLRALRASVHAVACHGTCPGDWAAIRQAAAGHSLLRPGYGLHPWQARSIPQRHPDWREQLEALLRADPRAAVGEIGLDHAPEYRDDDAQNSALLDQWNLSVAFRRPVVLHVRRAWEPMLAFLRARGPHPVGIVLHAYNGGAELVPTLIPFNAFFSFGGSVTFEAHRRPRQAVAVVPEERLLIETDAPDIAIAGLPAGRPPEPADLPLVGQAVADLRGAPLEHIARVTWNNAVALYGNPP